MSPAIHAGNLICEGGSMIDIEAIFRYKIPDREKLIQYGFELSSDTYKKSFPIMRKQFYVVVTVETKG